MTSRNEQTGQLICKRSKAFTLVELLVVIGIIALLISVLLPALAKARRSAQEVQCQSNMRQFGIGFQMYADANKGQMPLDGPDGGDAGANLIGPPNGVTGIDDPSLWYNAVSQATFGKSYYQMLVEDQTGVSTLANANSTNIFICPSTSMPGSLVLTGAKHDTINSDGQFFMLNAVDSTKTLGTGPILVKMFMSYVLNSMPFGKPAPSPSDPSPKAVTRVMISKLKPANLVPLLTERLSNYGEYLAPSVQKLAAAYPATIGKNITTAGYNSVIGQPKANWKRFTTRHREGGHLLFADGHVEWFKWTETQWQNPVAGTPAMYDVNQPNRIIWEPFGWIN